MSTTTTKYEAYCKQCACSRRGVGGDFCWKCQSELVVPASGWVSPSTPDVNKIRAAAHSVGFAIGEHGSKEADLDLIAVRWTENVTTVEELIAAINVAIGARTIHIEQKPAGRVAVTLQMIEGYYKPIDLSIVGCEYGLMLSKTGLTGCFESDLMHHHQESK